MNVSLPKVESYDAAQGSPPSSATLLAGVTGLHYCTQQLINLPYFFFDSEHD